MGHDEEQTQEEAYRDEQPEASAQAEEQSVYEYSRIIKCFRRDIQNLVVNLRGTGKSREVSLAITKLQEAKMWLGKELAK